MGVLDDYNYNISNGYSYSPQSNNVLSVATFYDSEFFLDKNPETFSEFEYDTNPGGVVSHFEDIRKKINDIRDDIENLEGKYNYLIGLYDKFSNFDDAVNGIISRMNSSLEIMSKRCIDFVAQAHQEVEERSKTDASYIGSLGELDNYIMKLNDTGETNINVTPSSGGASYNQNISAMADDVIRGKYGVGPERQKALESLGYNYREIQDVVNQKLNGTYVEKTDVPSPVNTNQPDTNINNSTNTIKVEPDVNTNINTPTNSSENNPNPVVNDIPTSISYESTGNNYLDQINQIRMDNGLKPLTINNNLVSAANIRAQEASQKWSHTRPDGSSWSTVSNSTTGENLAFSSDPEQTVIRDWMNSPTHREVLLADDISSAGLSVYEKDGIYYIALEVG